MLQISNEKINQYELEKKLYSLRTLNTPRSGKILARWLIGIGAFGFVVLFLPWQQNIQGNGTVTALNPQDRPQTVQTAIPGRIEKWHVQEGQYVKKGDTILNISEIKDEYFDPQLLTRLQEQLQAKEEGIEATQAKIIALDKQIAALQQGLTYSLQKAENKLQQAQFKLISDSTEYQAEIVQNEIANRRFAGAESLYQNGLISLTDFESRKLRRQEVSAKLISLENKVLASRNEVLNAKVELNSIAADYADKIAKAQSDKSSAVSYLADAEAEYSKLRNKYASVEVRATQRSIVAPQAGFVVKALKAGIGETIKENDAVVTIQPDKPRMAVELYVKAMDVPLLSKGRTVRLEFDGWPALQFSGWPSVAVGTFGGKIAVIDYVNSQAGTYRILVVPDPSDEPWPEQLRMGSGVYGWAMLNDVPIWYEIWRQLNGFPPNLKSAPADEESK
jgi:membrane fusion protein, adhesin transport system